VCVESVLILESGLIIESWLILERISNIFLLDVISSMIHKNRGAPFLPVYYRTLLMNENRTDSARPFRLNHKFSQIYRLVTFT
jgi:hypothetical protein